MIEQLPHDDETTTGRRVDSDSGYDFLQQVPFESLYRGLVAHACSTARMAFGPFDGDRVVAAMLRSLPVSEESSPDDREEFERRLQEGDMSLLNDAIVEFDWQDIAAPFVYLFCFARHGEGPRADPKESRKLIQEIIAHFRRLVDDPGVRARVPADFNWFEDTLAAAEARWAIDHGLAVMPEALAALAGVKPKTLANLLAAGQMASDADGRIPTALALQYLDRRKGFIRSSWQDPSVSEVAGEDLTLSEQVFVPVDSDGKPFLPSTARPGRDGRLRYIIGEKSAPIYVDDYWKALSQLALMPVPRWRRPPASGSGSWGLVSGQEGWRRFPRSDLEGMLGSTYQASS